jgi:hypothetical protein
MLWWSSISITSLMKRSMCLGLMERMTVWRNWMLCPKLILCSATADLSRGSKRVWLWYSFNVMAVDLEFQSCGDLDLDSNENGSSTFLRNVSNCLHNYMKDQF